MLEIKNLHARIAEDGTEIIRGLNLTVRAGEVAAIMGPERLRQVDPLLRARRPPRLRGDRGRHPLQRPVDPRARPGGAGGGRHLPGLPVPDGDPGRGDHGVPQGGAQRAAQGARRGALEGAGVHQEGEGGGGLARHGRGDAEAAAQCRLFRRREEARRNPADEAAGADALRPRRDRFRASTSTRCASSPTASTRCARRTGRSW